MKRKTLLTLSWIYCIVIFFATLPVTFFLAARDMHSDDDFYERYLGVLLWPLVLLDKQKTIF